MSGTHGSQESFWDRSSAADYASSELVEEAKQEALNAVNDLRYRKGKINSLPDGQLKKCGAWTASDETALKVTMEDPESLYLRGFTGSVYDGSSWKSIDTEDAINRKICFTGASGWILRRNTAESGKKSCGR